MLTANDLALFSPHGGEKVEAASMEKNICQGIKVYLSSYKPGRNWTYIALII